MSKSRQAARKAAQSKAVQQQRRVRIGALAILALLVLGVVAYAYFGNTAPEQSLERLELDPILGNPDAPISIVEYGAYGCTACRAWHGAGIVEQILLEFPNQVKFIYRDMPIILPAWSQEIAEVAQCALDQSNESFWLLHDALFSQTIQGRTSQAEAVQLGANLGLDAEALRTCADGNTHYNTVIYDMNRSEARGIRGTPTWFVNGQQLFNASPDILREAIQSELSRLGL
ncbi:MAG: DsbA family protein [Chloroflexi bacterium]|nr:DsbA family protein [Chloroflexota bacterium]